MTDGAATGEKSLHMYTTKASHLRRLGEMEENAWREFYDKYRSLVYAIGARHGLGETDLEDLMQAVTVACCESLRDFVYDPKKCRFRSFLHKMVDNISFNIRRRNLAACRTPHPIPDVCRPEIEQTIMLEYRKFLLKLALERLKHSISSENFMIFEMLEQDGRPVAEVAQLTGRSAGALYVIRHRCLKKLRTIIAGVRLELETRGVSAPPAGPRTDDRA